MAVHIPLASAKAKAAYAKTKANVQDTLKVGKKIEAPRIIHVAHRIYSGISEFETGYPKHLTALYMHIY